MTEITPVYGYIQSKQKIDPLPQYPDSEHIVGLISNGIIGSFEMKMIENTGIYKFITTSQLVRISGLASSNERIRRKLSILRRNRILMRFSIEQDPPTNKKIFALDRFGYNIIKNYFGININWSIEYNLRPMGSILATLEFNEIALKAKDKKSVKDIKGLPEIPISENRVYIPTGMLATDARPFIFEVIRKTPDWKDELKEKIVNIEAYISKYNKEKPLIVIVAETQSHMLEIVEVFNEIRSEYYNDLGIKFSYDQLIKEYDISKIFCTIVNGQVRHIKSKILQQ